MNTEHHKQVTIFKVVVDFKTQKPRVASAQAVDKGGDCFWGDGRNGDLGFLQRIPKTTISTNPAAAINAFVKAQYDKSNALREDAASIDAVALAAEMLMASC